MGIQLSVHHQHVVPFVARGADERILRYRIVRIEVNHVAVLVGLIFLDQRGILGQREVFALRIFQQHEIGRFFGELFVGDDSVLNEYLQIVPLFLGTLRGAARKVRSGGRPLSA